MQIYSIVNIKLVCDSGSIIIVTLCAKFAATIGIELQVLTDNVMMAMSADQNVRELSASINWHQ